MVATATVRFLKFPDFSLTNIKFSWPTELKFSRLSPNNGLNPQPPSPHSILFTQLFMLSANHVQCAWIGSFGSAKRIDFLEDPSYGSYRILGEKYQGLLFELLKTGINVCIQVSLPLHFLLGSLSLSELACMTKVNLPVAQAKFFCLLFHFLSLH